MCAATPAELAEALNRAVATADCPAIEKLLQQGADLFWRLPSGVCAYEELFLNSALTCEQALMVWDLLEKSLPHTQLLALPASFRSGVTALHLAVLRPHDQIIGRLLNIGADINAQDRHGATPLTFSVSLYHPSGAATLSFLLNHGADPGIGDETGNTALHFAAEYLSVHACRAILHIGGGYRDIFPNSPLHLLGASCEEISQHEAREVVKTLVEAGLDVNAVNIDGVTPLHRAAVLPVPGAGEVIRALHEAGAHLEGASRREGFEVRQFGTPLHCSSRMGYTETTLALLQLGADPAAVDAQDHTPQQVAGDHNPPLRGPIRDLWRSQQHAHILAAEAPIIPGRKARL